MHRAAAAACLSVAAAVTLTACGSSSRKPDAAAPTGTAPEVVATAALDVANLTLADLPSGWTSAAHDPAQDAANDMRTAQVLACAGITDESRHRLASRYSPEFSEDSFQVGSEIDLYDSAAAVAAETSVFTTPKGQECYRSALRTKASQGLDSATLDSLTVTYDTTARPDVPGFVALVRIDAHITQTGIPYVIGAQTLILSKGKVTATLNLVHTGGTVPTPLVSTVAPRLARRVAALGS